jgi:hypothetical protein
MHPEIYNSNLSFDIKIFLQNKLDNNFKGDFKALLNDILMYSISPDVEDYVMAIHIRDYIQTLNKLNNKQ